MRVSFVNLLFLAITSLQVITAKSVHGQTAEHTFININEQHISLKDLFTEIEEQTHFLFVYAPEVIDKYQDVSINGGRRTVADVLSELFVGKSIVYSESGLNIIIRIHNGTVLKIAERGKSNTHFYQDLSRINGRVMDVNGDPLPGVNIVVKGTTIGTTTGKDGDYSIELPEGSNVLVFSFIGYKSITIETENQSTIDIVLEEDVAQLKEVVVNGGYYETTDKMKTGSIVKVTAKDIEKQPVTSPLLALQGRVPGLEITPSSGAPGVAPTIRIRGNNSLRVDGVGTAGNGNYPLYVIDGVPISSEPIKSWTASFTQAGYDPLSTINPANIESIEILKDGDATAIYGSRGANGVILITTKKNTKSAERTTIELSASTGVGQVSKRLKLMKTDEYLAMRREGIANDGAIPGTYDYDLILWDTTRYTDWQKKLIGGTAHITDIQANISSGAKNTSFRFNAGYHKETLVFPGDFGYRRATGQLSLNHRSENQKFSIALSTTLGIDNNHLFADGGEMMRNAITLAPNAPEIYLPDGTLNWEMHTVASYPVSTWVNPYSHLLKTQDAENFNTLNNVALTYELLPGLSLATSGGYSNFSGTENVELPLSSVPPDLTNRVGILNKVQTKRLSWIIEPRASYTKQLSYHRFDLLLGITLQSNKGSHSIIAANDYVSDALIGSLQGAGQILVVQDESWQYRYNSIYARVGYNWRGTYLLNLTVRRDGSSRFGPGNKFGNFGSIGAAWLFSGEKFVQDVFPFLTVGKLRASYGLTGNDQIGDYNYLNLYKIQSSKYGSSTGVAPYALNNPEFAWETTRKIEAAIEMSFFENRIGAELNWYRNRSSNQLVDAPLPLMTGFTSVLSNFDATVENSGWEFVVHGDILNSNTLSWNVSLNFSLPKNKLVEFPGIEESPYRNVYRVGDPLTLRWLYTWKGVNKETGLYELEDKNNDGLINDLDRTLFNLTGTRYYGGLNNSIQYKNFALSILFQYSHQNASRYMPGVPGKRGFNQVSDAFDDRWQRTDDEAEVQRFSNDLGYQSYVKTRSSNFNSTDASFVRIKTISLSFQFPHEWSEKAKLTESKLFLQGQNIFTLTKYEGLDPETGSGLPPLRIVTAGIQLKF